MKGVGNSLQCTQETKAPICRPTDVSARQLHRRVAVDVGQQAQAEALRVGGVREAVHRQRRLRGVEGLAHPLVELVVGNGAPEGGLAVRHWLEV